MTTITDKKFRDELMGEKKLEMNRTLEMIKNNTSQTQKTTKAQYRKNYYQTLKKKSRKSQHRGG